MSEYVPNIYLDTYNFVPDTLNKLNMRTIDHDVRQMKSLLTERAKELEQGLKST